MALILVVDDEARYRQMLTFFLKSDGHKVLTASNGLEALEILGNNPRIELVLLDALMPVLDGWETCRRLKALAPVPVIMLTALSDEAHEVRGLKNGADDYIGKPFQSRILLARVQVAVRKADRKTRIDPITAGPVLIDVSERRVSINGIGISLTPREFDLLAFLIQSPGQVHTRKQLITTVWGYGFEGGSRTVDTHIKSLRHKLGPAASCLQTYRGIGYAFRVGSP